MADWKVKIIGGQKDGKEFIVRNSSYENAIDEVFEDNDLSVVNGNYDRLEVTKIEKATSY